MSTAVLCLLAVSLELGWLALWPLSGPLSHSALFNTAFLAEHPLVAVVNGLLVQVARGIAPGWGTAPLTEPLGNVAFVRPAWALAGTFAWLGLMYLAGVALLDRGAARARAALPVVMLATMAFQATLLWLPGLFSQDVFSYVAYGRLSAVHGLNPYVWPPSVLAKDAVLPWVAPLWRTYAAPYGPAWLDVQWLMSRLTDGLSVAEQALAYRALSHGLLLINLALVWAMLRWRSELQPAQRTVALAAVAWNPLVLFEIGANGHNDALMVTCSLLAVLAFDWSRHGGLATVGLTLGALVKYLSGIGVVWVALAAAARATTLSGRIARLWLVATVCAGVIVIVAWPWLELPDSLDPLLAETTSVGYVNSLPDNIGVALSDGLFGPASGAPAASAREITRGIDRLLCVVIFGGYLVWEARRVLASPIGSTVTTATARSCLIYILLVSTSVQTWYFCLPVVLALTRGWGTLLSQITVGYSLLAVPVLYLGYYLRGSTPVLVYVAYAVLPLIPLLVAARGAVTVSQHVRVPRGDGGVRYGVTHDHR